MKPLERFEDKYEPEPTSGCWVWSGAQSKTGKSYYGFFAFGGKSWNAHRWAAKFIGGLPIENGQVNHRCDNGLCVNPDHLYIGTQQDNIRDSARRLRRRGTRKLSLQALKQARELYDSGDWTHKQIAERFNVHRSTITWALRHQT